MEAFQHYVVFIFNLQSSSSLILWLLRSTTSSALWPFDQKHHLQHFDLSISNIIFSTLTFQSATSSSALSISNNIIIILWYFDQKHHHENIIITKTSLSSKHQHHHHQNINMILPFGITRSTCLWYLDDPSCQNYGI